MNSVPLLKIFIRKIIMTVSVFNDSILNITKINNFN